MSFRDDACLYRRDGDLRGAEFGGVDELTQLEIYLAQNLFSWFRADSRVEASSKVTQFTDKVYLPSGGGLSSNARSIDPNHAFAQAAGALQAAAIATNALANNREVATFNASPFYISTLTAAQWAFANAGGGYAFWGIFVPLTVSAVSAIASTVASGGFGGVQHLVNASGSMRLAAYTTAPSASIPDGDTGTVSLNTLVSAHARHASAFNPNFVGGLNGALLRTGTYATAPTGATPQSPMTIGATSAGGANRANALIADLMFANQWSLALDAAVQRYRLLRYFPA